MKFWMKGLLAATALTLSGCNMYKLEELRHTTPQGSPFQSQLSKLYMDYAERAEKNYDWANSWHFADKGLMLAYGKDVPPEDPNDWSLPADARSQIDRAHAELMAVLTPDVMQVAPARAAEAQFYFDCWVKEQEQNWREDEIATCHDGLDKALNDLSAPGSRHARASSELPKPMTAAKHKKAHAVKPMGEEKASAPLDATQPAGAPEAVAPVVAKPAKKAAKPTKAAEATPDYYKEEVATTTPKPQIADEVKQEAPKAEAKKPAKAVKIDTKAAKEEKEATKVATKEAPKETKDTSALPESTSYAVFFEPDKAEVSEPGMNVITEVIKSLQGVSDYAVILHTSKDHPGKAAERIAVVKKLLVAGGVKDGSIRLASGKTEVETGKSPSRRVEIFLNE